MPNNGLTNLNLQATGGSGPGARRPERDSCSQCTIGTDYEDDRNSQSYTHRYLPMILRNAGLSQP
jgi:hypothetical protein